MMRSKLFIDLFLGPYSTFPEISLKAIHRFLTDFTYRHNKKKNTGWHIKRKRKDANVFISS